MDNILVSICCITYNHVNYLEECLNGFLIQKCNFSIEILIHDDASTDGTIEIIKKYQEKYPDIILPVIQAENIYSKGLKNIQSKFNFSRARGKYIAICEGDDYWTDPHKLQCQVDFLEKNPDYIITYHDADIIDEKGEVIKKGKLPERFRRDMDKYFLQTEGFVLTLTMVFRNIIKEFPDEVRTVRNGDKFLISLLGTYGQGKFIPGIKNACYRRHSGGVWSSLVRKGEKYEHQSNTFLKLHEYHLRTENIEVSNFYYLQYSKAVLLTCGADAYRGDLKNLVKNSRIYLGTKENLKIFKLTFCISLNLLKGSFKKI